jgi:hypothetical protein
MPTTNGCKQGGKRDEPGVLPVRRREREGGGEETPSELESLGGDDDEEDEDKEEGEVSSDLQGMSVPPSLPSLGFCRSRRPCQPLELSWPRWWGRSHRAPGVQSPRPRLPALGLSFQCPLGMFMALFIAQCHSRFSYTLSDFGWWCWGDRSHTSLVLVIHRPAARLVTSPRLPLVASWAVSMGDLVMVALGPP